MKKTLSIVLFVLLVFLAVACSPETHKHTWDNGITSLPATCETSGVKTYTCTVCGETNKEEIAALGHSGPVDPTNSEEIQELNCQQVGVYKTVCTRCGQVFNSVVTPEYARKNNITLKHVLASDKTTEVNANGTGLKYTNAAGEAEIIAATAFSPKATRAFCAACGDAMDDTYKKIDSASGSATYGDIAGMWKVTYTNSNVLYKTYIDLTLTQAGAVDATKSKVLVTTVTDGVASTATKILDVGLALSTSGVRTLTFTMNGDELWTLTESDGKYKVTSKDGAAGAVTLYPNSSDDTALVEYRPNHNHLYDTTSAMTANTSIYRDENFKAMKHYGYPMICDGVTERVAASTGYDYDGHTGLANAIYYKAHYLECSICGLNYLKVEHTSYQETVNSTAAAVKNDKSCPVCYYNVSKTTSDGTVFCLVEETTSSNQFYVPTGSILNLSYSEYVPFAGKKVQIKGWTCASGIIAQSDGSFLVSATGTLTYVAEES